MARIPNHVLKKVEVKYFDNTKPYIVFRNGDWLMALNLTERFLTQFNELSTQAFKAKLDTLKKALGEPIRIDANEAIVGDRTKADSYCSGIVLATVKLGNAKVRVPVGDTK